MKLIVIGAFLIIGGIIATIAPSLVFKYGHFWWHRDEPSEGVATAIRIIGIVSIAVGLALIVGGIMFHYLPDTYFTPPAHPGTGKFSSDTVTYGY